jgi:hypothetical protein
VAEELRGWPALTACQVDCGASRGFALRTREIVHLHSANEAELCLTWPVVQRMHKVLLDCGQVMMEPGADWIRVRLGGDSDIRLLLSLVSVAIQANAPVTGGALRRWTAPCPRAGRLTASRGR